MPPRAVRATMSVTPATPRRGAHDDDRAADPEPARRPDPRRDVHLDRRPGGHHGEAHSDHADTGSTGSGSDSGSSSTGSGTAGASATAILESAPRGGRRPGRARQPDRPRVLRACRRAGRDRRRQGRALCQACRRGDLRRQRQAGREVAHMGVGDPRLHGRGRRRFVGGRDRHLRRSRRPRRRPPTQAPIRPTTPTRPDRAAPILRP